MPSCEHTQVGVHVICQATLKLGWRTGLCRLY